MSAHFRSPGEISQVQPVLPPVSRKGERPLSASAASRPSRAAKAVRPLPPSEARRPLLSCIPVMPAPEFPRDRLLALLDRFPQQRLVVFGDLIADEFVYGRVARVSREAPVLIL